MCGLRKDNELRPLLKGHFKPHQRMSSKTKEFIDLSAQIFHSIPAYKPRLKNVLHWSGETLLMIKNFLIDLLIMYRWRVETRTWCRDCGRGRWGGMRKKNSMLVLIFYTFVRLKTKTEMKMMNLIWFHISKKIIAYMPKLRGIFKIWLWNTLRDKIRI
jgi:hypothetical protein